MVTIFVKVGSLHDRLIGKWLKVNSIVNCPKCILVIEERKEATAC